MRGNRYYCSRLLAKGIFHPGLKKDKRINLKNPHQSPIVSYNSFKTYVSIFDNFFAYLEIEFSLKNFQLIEEKHIVSYLIHKIRNSSSKQYLQKIVSALGKLEYALTVYSTKSYSKICTKNKKNAYKKKFTYDFSIRKKILKIANSLDLIESEQVDRTYSNPEEVIAHLSNPKHRLAAKIQLVGGARFVGVRVIEFDQAKGYFHDKIEDIEYFQIETKEKGGRKGNVFIEINDYYELQEYFCKDTFEFQINYQEYAKDIRNACQKLGIECFGSHGFRYNYTIRRLIAYQDFGYTYMNSLKSVSQEIKHTRTDIIEGVYGR